MSEQRWARSEDLSLLDRVERMYILRLGDGEKCFSPRFTDWVMRHLERVASDENASALVTIALGRIWASGFDPGWMATHRAEAGAHLRRVDHLYAVMLQLPVTSVAAIQGHAYAA